MLIACALIALTAQLNAVMIHLSNMRQSIIQAADQHLARQGFPVKQIPARLMNEYYQKIDAVMSMLNQQASSQGRSYVDDGEISSAVLFEFAKYCDNLRTVVLFSDISTKLTDIIQEAFRTQNTSTSSIPSTMMQEFQDRRETIMRRLRNIMNTDNRDYVRINEIERLVKEEMTSFIQRTKQQVEKPKQQNSGFNLWNFLFGSDNQPEQLPTTSTPQDASKIKQFQLESKVLDVVYRQLGLYNIDPHNLPNRVLTDYSNSIQYVLTNLRNRMQTYNRDYVTIAEIELMVNQKLKAIVDQVKLTGKECSICRDDYRSGQRVGNLTCGHLFHKECISTWFVHKQTCPECYQTPASIVAEEIIP